MHFSCHSERSEESTRANTQRVRSRGFFAALRMTRVVAAALLAGSFLRAADPTPAKPAHTFAIGDENFLLDGQRFQIRCGELHFARVPREYWRHRLQLMKAMGLNTVCAYLFWNFHEWEPGKFDWSGQE